MKKLLFTFVFYCTGCVAGSLLIHQIDSKHITEGRGDRLGQRLFGMVNDHPKGACLYTDPLLLNLPRKCNKRLFHF